MLLFQEKAVHQVVVNSANVNIETFFIEDSTKKCKVVLWRSWVDHDVRFEDFVEIIVNNYRNELSLSTTSRTVITARPIFLYELFIIVPYLEIIITIEVQFENKFLKD